MGFKDRGLLSTYRKVDKQANYKAYEAKNNPLDRFKSKKIHAL
jgi:hypothetical protein